MSTGLELIPLALAAGAAIAAVRRRTGRSREPILAVETRLRDEALLVAALGSCGRQTGVVDGLPHGVVDGVELALTPAADGTWSVLFDGSVPAGTAEAIVLRLDAAYCVELADRLTRELRDRAAELGLTSSEPRPGPDGGAVVSVRADSGEGAAIRIGSDGTIGASTFGSTGERCLPWIATVEHCSAATSVRSEYTSDFFATGSIGHGAIRHSTAQQAEQVLWQQGVTVRVAMVVPRTAVEGPGLRAAVWVQGCAIRCPGCVNPHLWHPAGGRDLGVEELLDELRIGDDPPPQGITLLGGEPFDQAPALAEVATAARGAGLSVMTFTGYRYEELRGRADAAALLGATDLLVDGPYLHDHPDRTRPWAGSTNQRFLALTPRYAALVRDLPAPDVPLEVHVLADGRVQVTGTPVPELLAGLRTWLGVPRPRSPARGPHTPTWTNGAQ